MRGRPVIRQAWATASVPFRSVIRKLGRPIVRTGAHLVTGRWQLYSRLFLVSDGASWVVSEEMRELAVIAQQIGVRLADSRWLPYARHQAVFYGDRHALLLTNAWEIQPHRLATAYFHGRPGTGVPMFDQTYAALCRAHPRIHRVQVSHSEMRDVVLSSGIDPQKVFLIPIGVNLSYFHMQTSESQQKARAKYDIPQSAVVVGSFQKDGVGWGEGMQPKLSKGPDVFLKTIEILKARVPELFVLLLGPARGYVKAGLERLGVLYSHHYLKSYP